MAVVSKNKGLAFGFENSVVFSLLFLLTTLETVVVLSNGLFEAVKGP